MTYIKAGWGYSVGQDFNRASVDIPIKIETVQGCWVYGTIEGNPQSRLGFMRQPHVQVRVRIDGVMRP